MSSKALQAFNVDDFRVLARKRLPKGLFEFVDRGTEDEVALLANRSAFARYKFIPRTLVDVSARSSEITLFGRRMAMPLAIAPTGVAGLMWHDGEVALAKAAASRGVPFTVATGSLTSLERVADESGGSCWFQLYMWPQKALSMELVQRAQKAGFEALLVTVDTAVGSNREYNLRNGFSIPFKFSRRNIADVLMHPRWLFNVLARYMVSTGMPKYENYPEQLRSTVTAKPIGKAMAKADNMTWDDFRAIRKMWSGPLMAKGILHPLDARQAINCGADAIVVSNHGGRMLDHSIPPLLALPAIVQEVNGRCPVLLDSGITRGSDVVKALALGASAVLAGRATLYGVATCGQPGAQRVLGLLEEEILRTLGLIGCPDIGEVSSRCLYDMHQQGPLVDSAFQ